jgi:amino acid transporter
MLVLMLMGQSRVFYMSKDGLLPSFFSDIHQNSELHENKSFLHGICKPFAVLYRK